MKYTIKLTQVIERKITCEIESDSRVKALDKAKKSDWDDSDEEYVAEDLIEIKDVRIVE